MENDTIGGARASYLAYVNKDRAAIEALIADDFHFTSPLDNRLDRATYFERCWPNSQMMEGFDFIHTVLDGQGAPFDRFAGSSQPQIVSTKSEPVASSNRGFRFNVSVARAAVVPFPSNSAGCSACRGACRFS